MRILLYADLRTTHAREWLRGLLSADHDVLAVSSELLNDSEVSAVIVRRDPVTQARKLAVASGISQRVRRLEEGQRRHRATPGQVRKSQVLDTLLAVAKLPAHVATLKESARKFRPDVVQALRLPYEGLIALKAVREVPVVVSTWGQDFTWQARADPLLDRWYRHAVPLIAGLHVDSQHDYRNALSFGLRPKTPWLYAAGNFGVPTNLFFPEPKGSQIHVLYPRGMKPYIRRDVFLDMVEAFKDEPSVRFTGVGLEEDPRARQLARTMSGRLQLTGSLPRTDFASLMRSAHVVVSPAESDGTPNTVVEGLACGAFIIASDIPGLAEFLIGEPGAILEDGFIARDWVRALNTVIEQERWQVALNRNPELVPAEFNRQVNRERVSLFLSSVTGR